jgi:hypothetical protein
METILEQKKVGAVVIIVTIILTVMLLGCNVFNPTPKSLNLVNGVISIQAGSYYDIPFTVDTSFMKDVRVEGTFQASGPSGNCREALILEHMDFINWVNGHAITPVYYSGQVTFTDINVNITSSGEYHLVFDNRLSIISTKNVSAQVDLYWSD